MNVRIYRTQAEVDAAAAWMIVRQILDKPESVIGLATGRTTTPVHQLVARIYRTAPFDASKAVFFGMDEVTGVPREFEGACYTMIRHQLLDALGVGDDRFIMLPVRSDDFEADCRRFSDALQTAGGVDFLELGLGSNAHLGFNQPGTPFGSVARTSYMMEDLQERLRKESGASGPLGGVTMGIKEIMNCRKIMLAAKGPEKAEAVRNMIKGPVTEDVPASVLQLHPDCTILLDQEAASKI